MRIVVAPDSYKGSISSIEACNIMRDGINSIFPEAKVTLKPMADGGEGTLDSLVNATNGKKIPITCTGPLGKSMHTEYGLINGNTAVIECAAIAGLTQVPVELRNPDNTTSYGLGEAITDALDRECTEIIIGLGGSAVNDAGLGLLVALGMKALNESGDIIGYFGRNLQEISSVDTSRLDSRLSSVSIKVACDVDNPLCGKRGATYVYGPQKGATDDRLEPYDQAIKKYANLIEEKVGGSYKELPGAGAAGGLGFALLALGAEIVPGARFIADVMNVEGAISDADLVFTGEGQSDEQTLYGKAPGYVASLANKYNVPVILLSGGLSGDLKELGRQFTACFSITNRPLSLEESIERSKELLYEQTRQILKLITSVRSL
ncbi:glycerate kinase [Ornithinibacillus californiensis]|uniref:glycerate kinase n=1 Tax=Ornithinibacillus californiensis TaxID=161536 RepID=UPI00064D7D1B|nr:glycerate kinase [Ornithinibacillus californiensis]